MTVRRMDALLAALERGPCLIGEWAARAGSTVLEASGSMQWLLRKRRVIEIGTLGQAREAGVEVGIPARAAKSVRSDSKVYALPGTPMLPALRQLPRLKTKSGSGVIAAPKQIRGYLWR